MESCPDYVIAHINEYRGKLLEGDEKWCVVDHDCWTVEQLGRLREWVESTDEIVRGCAVSNPKFELWLLAHFRDLPNGHFGCVQLLKVYMPNYDKHIDSGKITEESVLAAISRGKIITPTGEPPLTCPGTNLWVLLERMSSRPNIGVAKCGCAESVRDSGILVQDEFSLDDCSANK